MCHVQRMRRDDICLYLAPHNIIAGSATVGLVGREGDILARTAAPCASYTGIGDAAIFGLVLWR